MSKKPRRNDEAEVFSVGAIDPSFCPEGLSATYKAVSSRKAGDFLDRIGRTLDTKKVGQYIPRIGEYAHGYVYDGTMVVKESRAEQPMPYIGTAHLEQEQDVLRHLAKSKLPVPRALFADRHSTLFITTLPKGRPLGEFHYAHIDPEDRRSDELPLTGREKVKLARDIVDFMVRLGEAFEGRKASNILRVPAGQIVNENSIQAAIDNGSIQEELGARCSTVRNMMKEYIGSLAGKKRPAIPAKLSPRTILLDPETRAFAGVSDMTGVRKGRPEEALLELYRTYPPEFTKLLCRTYSKRTGQKIELRDMLLCDVADRLQRAAEYAAEGKWLLMEQTVANLQLTSGNGHKVTQKAHAKSANKRQPKNKENPATEFAAKSANLKSPKTPPTLTAKSSGKESTHESSRPSAPRRKRVEQRKPVHGI